MQTTNVQGAIRALKAGKKVTLDGDAVELLLDGALWKWHDNEIGKTIGRVLRADDLLRDDFIIEREYFGFLEAMKRLSEGKIVANKEYADAVYTNIDGKPKCYNRKFPHTIFIDAETQSDRWYEVDDE